MHQVFSFLTAYAEHPDYSPLLVAPLDLLEKCLAMIAREAEHARAGRPARIIAKMNALLDQNVIAELYRASQAGVEIDLIVRGICALRPGIRGVSNRIRVRSIVGRFLEHSRIFYFSNGGDEEIYIGSADWMPRNLYDRVEAMVPVRNPMLRERIHHEILGAYLADNMKTRILQSDGSYVHTRLSRRGRASGQGPSFNAQEFMMGIADGKLTPAAIPERPVARGRKVSAGRAS